MPAGPRLGRAMTYRRRLSRAVATRRRDEGPGMKPLSPSHLLSLGLGFHVEFVSILFPISWLGLGFLTCSFTESISDFGCSFFFSVISFYPIWIRVSTQVFQCLFFVDLKSVRPDLGFLLKNRGSGTNVKFHSSY
jgi:hypothetical protein